MKLSQHATLERSWSLLLLAAFFCAGAGLSSGQSAPSGQGDQGAPTAGQNPQAAQQQTPDGQQAASGQSALPEKKTEEQKTQPAGTAAPAITPVGTTNSTPAPAAVGGSVGSAITPVGTTTSTPAPAAVGGSVGSAITPIGTTNSAPASVSGSVGSAITPIGTTTSAPSTVKGSVGSALEQPADQPEDTETPVNKPVKPQQKALPGLTVTPTTNFSTTVKDEPGAAINSPAVVDSGSGANGNPGSAVSQPVLNGGKPIEGETGNAVDQPETETDNAVMGDTGAAVNEPAMTNGARVIEGDLGSAISQPTLAPGKTLSGAPGSAVEQPATAEMNGVSGDTGAAVNQPELLKGSKPAEGNTGKAVEQPSVFVGAKFVEGETVPAVNQPYAGINNKPTGDTESAVNQPELLKGSKPVEGDPGKAVDQPAMASANSVMGDTLKAIEQPANIGRLWSPDNPTNVAMGDVNYAQPEMIVPGVALGQQPYIHLAVEPTHLAHSSYKFTNGTAQGVKPMVLVQQKDVRDYGSALRQMTYEGHLVIDIPQGWRRTVGVGLLYYVPDKSSHVSLIKNPLHSGDASIYATAIHIDPTQIDRDTNDFVSADTLIRSDISGYKARFKRAVVHEAEPVTLPLSKAKHVTYTFQSHEKENAYEEVVYIDEGNRVLALTLSTGDARSFREHLPTFLKFVKSYQGNIPYGPRAPQ